jgi:NAD(P)-dependent dehydrogenase (short-subunit alcohol dehydrogenase family)
VESLKARSPSVTGAASGIGRATATLFNSRGASVVAEDIKPEVDELARDNGGIATIVGDVSSEETARAQLLWLLSALARLTF